MSIKLRSSLSAALSPSKGERLGSISFTNGGSSALILMSEYDGVLVNCPPSACEHLEDKGLIREVNIVVVLSLKEEAIGSLATLVSKKRDQPLLIICSTSIIDDVQDYLCRMNQLDESKFRLTPSGLQEKAPVVRFGDGPSMLASFLVEDEQVHFLFGWRSEGSAFDTMDVQIVAGLRGVASNTVVVQDTSFEKGACHPEKLNEHKEVFRNFLIFGHDEKEGERIVFKERYMRSLMTVNNNEFIVEKK